MATEVELKLRFPPDALARIESHPLIQAGILQGAAKRLSNTYFDTPDLALHKKRIALRIRQTGTETLQTVKCATDSFAGLSSRPEWEHPYAGDFDFAPVDKRSLRTFLDKRRAELVPVFRTDFERRTWRIDVSRKISIWVMIDSGIVASGDRELPISEVELELAQGQAEDLLDFAIALAGSLPLLPDNASKAERGYQLFLQQGSGPQKSTRSALTSGQTTGEAFRMLAAEGLRTWQANQLGVVSSDDPEFVHQFRVSLRRMNSLLKVFRPVLPARFARHWTKELKALSRITGDLRDLEVMNASILQPIRDSNKPQDQALALQAMQTCLAARHEALGRVDRLQLGGPLLAFASQLQAMKTEAFPDKLAKFAEKRLGKLQRTAVKRLNDAQKSPTPDAAHRLRIALKHLRYTCEFFAPLFDARAMLQHAKAVARLQDAFGFTNDYHVALDRLTTWVDQGLMSKEARQAIVSWHAARARKTLGRALRQAEQQLGRCQPWCTACAQRGLQGVRNGRKQNLRKRPA